MEGIEKRLTPQCLHPCLLILKKQRHVVYKRVCNGMTGCESVALSPAVSAYLPADSYKTKTKRILNSFLPYANLHLWDVVTKLELLTEDGWRLGVM